MAAPTAQDGAPTDRQLLTMAILTVALTAVGMGQSMVFAVVPLAARDIGFVPTQIGLIFAVSAVAWMVMSPLWGSASDLLGRRVVLAAGLLGFAASLVLFASALRFGEASALGLGILLVLLIAARMFNGVFGSATRPAAMGYVADVTGPRWRSRGMARVESGFTIGTVSGPVVGALLLVYSNYLPFYVFAGMAVCIAPIAWLSMSSDRSRGQTKRARVKRRAAERSNPEAGRLGFLHPLMRPFLLVGLALGFSNASYVQTLGLFIADATAATGSITSKVSLAFAISAAGVVTAQLIVVDRLRVSDHLLVKLGASLGLLAWVGLATADSLQQVYASMGVYGLGFGMLRVGNASLLSQSVSSWIQGRASGLLGAVMPSGHIITPLVTMQLYVMDPHYPYMAVAGVLALTCLLVHVHGAYARDPSGWRARF